MCLSFYVIILFESGGSGVFGVFFGVGKGRDMMVCVCVGGDICFNQSIRPICYRGKDETNNEGLLGDPKPLLGLLVITCYSKEW